MSSDDHGSGTLSPTNARQVIPRGAIPMRTEPPRDPEAEADGADGGGRTADSQESVCWFTVCAGFTLGADTQGREEGVSAAAEGRTPRPGA